VCNDRVSFIQILQKLFKHALKLMALFFGSCIANAVNVNCITRNSKSLRLNDMILLFEEFEIFIINKPSKLNCTWPVI